MFCNDNGLFNEKGSYEFMNRITGLVSYIDRMNDRSQFAYPVIKDVLIDVERQKGSESGLNEINNKIKEYDDKLNNKEQKLDKEEIKVIKKEIANMKKEQKKFNKQKDEPKDIIDFINNCFIKKPKREKARDAGDAGEGDDDKPKKAAKAAVPKPPKECQEGKVLNPKTGRCIKQKKGDAQYSF